jgi:Flp pilus assembly protein TadB
LAATVCFAALPVLASVVAAAGGASLPLGMTAVATLALAPIGFAVPDALLRSEAAARRRDFRHALGAYLDLVSIVVAGGSGPEGALHDAVRSGNGWAFRELEMALESARLAGAPPWEALARLGEELGVTELVELAASVSLAGEHGAKVRASLTAKAASIRDHELSETEAEAQAATEKMAIPVVLMLFGFLVFVGYPAMDNVLTGL